MLQTRFVLLQTHFFLYWSDILKTVLERASAISKVKEGHIKYWFDLAVFHLLHFVWR